MSVGPNPVHHRSHSPARGPRAGVMAGAKCGSPWKPLTPEEWRRAVLVNFKHGSPLKPLTWRVEDVIGASKSSSAWMDGGEEVRRERWRGKDDVGKDNVFRTVTKQTHNKHRIGTKLPTPQPHTFYDLVKFSLA